MHSLDNISNLRASWTFRRILPAESLVGDPVSELVKCVEKLAQAIQSQLNLELRRVPSPPESSIVASFLGGPVLVASWRQADQFGEIMISTSERSLCIPLSLLADQFVPHITLDELLHKIRTAKDERHADRTLMMLFFAADNGDEHNEEVAQTIVAAWEQRPDSFRKEMIWAISGLTAYWPDIMPMLERSLTTGLPWDLESSTRTVFQLVQIELDLPSDMP